VKELDAGQSASTQSGDTQRQCAQSVAELSSDDSIWVRPRGEAVRSALAALSDHWLAATQRH
jgi:hypothetical protein